MPRPQHYRHEDGESGTTPDAAPALSHDTGKVFQLSETVPGGPEIFVDHTQLLAIARQISEPAMGLGSGRLGSHPLGDQFLAGLLEVELQLLFDLFHYFPVEMQPAPDPRDPSHINAPPPH